MTRATLKLTRAEASVLAVMLERHLRDYTDEVIATSHPQSLVGLCKRLLDRVTLLQLGNKNWNQGRPTQ